MSDSSSPDGIRALSDGKASSEPPLLDSDLNETAASASEEVLLLHVGVPTRLSWHDAWDDICCRQNDAPMISRAVSADCHGCIAMHPPETAREIDDGICGPKTRGVSK